jgi:hypothetical protein
MNHKPTILVVTAMVAAMVMTGIAAMATPQLALAGGYHHHHQNGVKVNQSTDQANLCSGPIRQFEWVAATDGSQSTVCLNEGSNNADIQR